MINETLKFTNCAPPKKKKKKKTEPCSVEKKGFNTFAKGVNLHLSAQAMDLMNPQFGNILFCIINLDDAITFLLKSMAHMILLVGIRFLTYNIVQAYEQLKLN